MSKKYKMYALVVVSLLFSCITGAQTSGRPQNAEGQKMVSATVIDAVTGEPIIYANVGIEGKGLGTVTDEEGFFVIPITGRVEIDDIFKISMLGYTAQTFTISDFLKQSNAIITLSTSPYSLDEVTVTQLVKERKTLGFPEFTDGHLGYWKGNEGLGGEIATRINIKKRRTKLLKVTTNVFVVNADSALVRLNIYDYKKRLPGDNLVRTPIYNKIKTSDKTITIDISAYNIIVDRDIVVSFELVNVYGEKIQTGIYGSNERATSFTREVSQDSWKRHDGKGVAIAIEVGQIKKEVFALSTKRDKPENIQVFWDVSRTMKTRNFEKEFDFLKSYLKDHKNGSVVLVVFNNQLQDVKEYPTIEELDFDLLKIELAAYQLDGMADYNHLDILSHKQVDNILVFTDGNSILGTPQRSYNSSVFTISSSQDANNIVLQDVALYNDGHYVNLATTSVKEALSYLEYKLEDLQVYSSKKDKTSWSKGKVYLDSIPLEGALVSIVGTFVEEQTDSAGVFRIPSQVGDLLKFDYFGTISKEIRVDNSQPIEVYLTSIGDRLEEVILTTKKKKVKRNSKNRVDNAVFEVTESDINPKRARLVDVLRETTSLKFENGGLIFFPKAYSSPGMPAQLPSFLVDGILFAQGSEPYIAPSEISSISIINPRTSLNYYNIGGGLIVIRTKSYQEKLENRPVDKVTEQNADESITYLKPQNYELSYSGDQIIQELDNATSFKEALALYYNNIDMLKNVPFYIEAGEVFTKWDTDVAAAIMSNALVLAPKNTRVLKIVASYFEQFNKTVQAESIYSQRLLLLPSDRLALRDLSMIAEINGKYGESLEGYKFLAVSSDGKNENKALTSVVRKEFDRLLTVHNDAVSDYSDNQYLDSSSTELDLRIVISWIPDNLDFELEFVSPDNKKFYWKLADREKNVVGSEAIQEFFIQDSLKGEWLLNIKSNGDEELFQIPPYLKLAIYKNFATAEEEKEVRTIKILNQKEFTTIGRILL